MANSVPSTEKESSESAYRSIPNNLSHQQLQQSSQPQLSQPQLQQHPAPPPPSHQPPPPHRYHHPYPPPPPPPPPGAPYSGSGPYSAAMAKPGGGVGGPYHHAPPAPRLPQQGPPSQGQGPPPATASSGHLSSPLHGYERDEQGYPRQIPVRGHEAEYRGHPHPPAGAYQVPPPAPPPHYGPPPEDRRWMGPEGVPGHPPPHRYGNYDGRQQSFPPHHMAYRYPHPAYPNSRLEDGSRIHGQPPLPPPPPPPPQPASSGERYNNDVDGREGATSPSQIEMSHRDEVTNMGCTCKKTKCLKLYCQCFAVKIYCAGNCRCLVCFNTVKHEKLRKDAMRSILSRNPTAFDTKFSKTKERKAKEPQLVLAHKLGCKCRKSACMKKYCECYAGNVKCSPNCRCIGCKNNVNGPFGSSKPGDTLIAPRESASLATYEMAPPARTGREPWMMNAAQNLTFLKHGSPSAEKRVKSTDPGDMGSMPSLAASSSDTSPGEKVQEAALHKTPIQNQEEGNSVDTLLMAAYAMTEFQSQRAPSHPPPETSAKDAVQADPDPNDNETSSRKVLFRPSPKRKSSDARAPDAVQSEVEASIDEYEATVEVAKSGPLDPRDMKRTRLGSARRRAGQEDGKTDKLQASPDNCANRGSDPASIMQETPDHKAMVSDKLTPVSARCIDFKRMHVNERSSVDHS